MHIGLRRRNEQLLLSNGRRESPSQVQLSSTFSMVVTIRVPSSNARTRTSAVAHEPYQQSKARDLTISCRNDRIWKEPCHVRRHTSHPPSPDQKRPNVPKRRPKLDSVLAGVTDRLDDVSEHGRDGDEGGHVVRMDGRDRFVDAPAWQEHVGRPGHEHAERGADAADVTQGGRVQVHLQETNSLVSRTVAKCQAHSIRFPPDPQASMGAKTPCLEMGIPVPILQQRQVLERTSYNSRPSPRLSRKGRETTVILRALAGTGLSTTSLRGTTNTSRGLPSSQSGCPCPRDILQSEFDSGSEAS